jgi:hypothetical protein
MIDSLRKHGIAIVDWSCICKSNGETVDYLYILYDIARELGLVVCVFGVQWVMPRMAIELFYCWKGQLSRNCSGSFREMNTHF